MTIENTLDSEKEKLLMKDMENKYFHLREMEDEFVRAKKIGIEDKVIKPEKYLILGPLSFRVIETPRGNFKKALEDYKKFVQQVESFGLSAGKWSVNVEAYEGVLKDK